MQTHGNRGVRLAGAAALVVSALSFWIGLVALFRAEGPASPDLNVFLSDPGGRADLTLMVFAMTAALVLFLAGLLVVVGSLDQSMRSLAIIASGLSIAAVPLFVGFLALDYALVGVLNEGIDPNSQGFRILFLQAHAAGDWAGWTGIVLLASSLLALGFALVREGSRVVGWGAVAVAAIGLVLIPTGFGFAFTLILPFWEVTAAAHLARTP